MEYADGAPKAAEGGMTRDELVRMGEKWIARIKAAAKREDAWLRQAEEAEKAYLSDGDSATAGKVYDFNILHSNIETIVPAVFNSAPVPDIRERFRTGPSNPETAAAREAAKIIERAIMVQVDDSRMETELEEVTQSALLSGRGVIRVRFEADEEPGAPMMGMDGMPILGPDGQPMLGPPVITNERLTFEAVSFRDYREGPAKRWSAVPWVAFRHTLDQEELDRIRDEELKAILGATEGEADDDQSDVAVWEIWCKTSGRVYMIAEASSEVLYIKDDPLGLSGFFPMPPPVQPIGVTGKRTPLTPFHVYKKLADELETITRRIAAITDGLKVRGLFAGSTDDLAALADAADNVLIPVANVEGLAATGGLSNAIVWWPVEQAIVVLRELYGSRDQTKSMIYEVTGISDIVRGQGKASETATAQEIKSQWGSLRIRKLQRQLERCARDTFVICAEMIGPKFSVETLQRMTGVQVTSEVAAILQAPLDHYRIDVESDSTVRADLSRRKGEMSEFLQGTAAFFSTMAPVVAQAPQIAAPVMEIYASFARQFNLGKQAEDALETMAQIAQQPPQQPQGPPQPPPKEQAQTEKLAAEAEQTRAETALMMAPPPMM